MAKPNRSISRANRNIQNIAKGVSANMDSLYRSTYMASPKHSKDIEDLASQINDNIDSIVNRNVDTFGVPSVSKLYSRMANSIPDDSKTLFNDLDSMFNNGMVTDDLYGLFMSNRYLKELDQEIDTVCKYMPKLEEALAVQRDCILSADHFSKEILSFEFPAGQITPLMSERFKDMKKKYKLTKLIEEIYENTSKYGEQFVYRVPYKTAIGRLLANKRDEEIIAPSRGMNESSTDSLFGNDEDYLIYLDENSFRIMSETENLMSIDKPSVITEQTTGEKLPDGKDVTREVSSPLLEKDERFSIKVTISRSGMIESAVKDFKKAYDRKKNITTNSLASIHESTRIMRETKDHHVDAKGNIDIGRNPLDPRMVTANDGLVDPTKNRIDNKPKVVDVKAPGCLVKKLNREQVLPIYIDDICMGYYYFEIRTTDYGETFMGFKNILGDPLSNMRGDSPNAFNNVDNQRQDEAIKYVAGQLSKFIDKQFVNSNQDLSKEIYMILKYNDLFNTPSIDNISVTFIPPEDMVHFYFRLDPITHRGISDLDKSLIPAKIYSSLYITNAIGVLTRGQDKRVYYVKQSVDTNIARNLLSTIAQIKQSNFNIRQFQNINNVLNITGRFNDYVIPTNASGDAPIQFEVMPGQDINTPTELMESLEEMAINSTGIPIEIIQARQSIDYAMQLSMSSSKFLRFCYKRQELYQALLSELVTPMYNYEYDENIWLEVKLPPPMFINVTNTNQLVDNTKNLANSIVEVELAGEEDDKLKSKYTNSLFEYYIGTHLDVSAHKKLLDRDRIELAVETGESHSDGGSDY